MGDKLTNIVVNARTREVKRVPMTAEEATRARLRDHPSALAPIALADAVKRECGRRIMVELHDHLTQLNILSYGLGLALKAVVGEGISQGEAEAIAVLHECQLWIATMRATSDMLIEERVDTFTSDEHWPPMPVHVRTFIDNF